MTMNTDSPDRLDLLARALVQIKQLRQQVTDLRDASQEPIAIVGVGLRLPGGISDPQILRQRLCAGFDAITGIPPERWDMATTFDANPDALGKMYTRHGAFLDSIDGFDAAFFGISPKEAAAMDPQQRVFLEVVHEALERAGINVAGLEESRTAVYAGTTTWDYGARQVLGRPRADLDPYVMSGNIAAFTSGRISYTYGLQGASMSIDTACSSSLVAVHLATMALRRGETDLAIAGGVNIILAPEWNVVLSRARMMAPDGRCKTFDASADGYVRGEGCGVVVLKRWSAAQRDGDSVLAVIRGSAVNQDGPASGITVPNGLAQQKVIRAALADARVEPASIGYVEAHGTGTSLGDPIEVRSLAAVYGEQRTQPLRLGSIKTNLGHLEPAAGVVGMIKAALAVHHGETYPHLHLREVNPEIDLQAIPAEIPSELQRWIQADGQPRRAAVSSFGASGTNVHVVLEQVPATAPAPAEHQPRLLVLSAKTEASLEALVACHRDALAELPAAQWPDFCATSQRGRAPYPFRRAVVAADPAAASAQLELGDPAITGRAPASPPRIVMMFAGQGAQLLGMGRELYRQQAVYRDAFDQCDHILRPWLGCSLIDVIDGDAARPLDHTRFTQPALFAVEYALYQLWRSWGVEPAAVLGHSVGQYVAATVAGVFELADGLALIAARGQLMQALAGDGAMYALTADETRARALVAGRAGEVAIAAINGPCSVVISGLRPAIDEVADEARAAGIRVKPLKVSHAFHSPQMDPMLDAFRTQVSRIKLARPRLPLVCNVGGQLAGASITEPDYWVRHLREPVRFGDGLAGLHAAGHHTFLEVSPRPTLSGMARTALPDGCGILPSLREGKDELACMLSSLGELFIRGVQPDWNAVDRAPRRRIALPTYPFQRRRHWVDVELAAGVSNDGDTGDRPRHPLIDRRIPNPLALAQYEARLGRIRYGFLADFLIDQVNVVNIGVYLELLAGALDSHHGRPVAFQLDELTMQRACLLRDHGPALQLTLQDREGAIGFAIHGDTEAGAWLEHCGGRAVIDPPAPPPPLAAPAGDGARTMSGDQLYGEMRALGIELGSSGRWITEVRSAADAGRATATLRGPDSAETALMRGQGLHPGSIDALFQAAYAVLPTDVPTDSAYMLIGVAQLYVRPGALPVRVEVIRRRWDPRARAITVDLIALDAAGQVVIAADGAMLKYASRAMLRAQLAAPSAPVAPAPGPAALAAGRQELAAAPPAERRARLEQRLIALAARTFGASAADVERDRSLLDLGLDSLLAVELKRRIEADLGVPVALGSLLDGQSVAELAPGLIAQLKLDAPADAPAAARADSVALIPDPAHAHEPFSLTDLQQAYLIGRGNAFNLGNVSTYFFLEVDIHGLDLPSAEAAWDRVIARHGMLRAVFSDQGRQRVLPQVPPYRIAVADVRALPEPAREQELARLSAQVRDRVFDTSRWPLFEIRATRLDDRTTRLHLGIDALIVDAWSTSMVFDEWARLHRGETLPEVALSFRDYMEAMDGLRRSEAYAEDLRYWEARVATMPPAPELPLARSPESIPSPRFGHRTARLDPAAWQQFQAHARDVRVTPSAALCAVYAEVIATWSRSRHFTLNLLFFNRLPLHPDVKAVAANFSSTTLLEIDARTPCALRDRAQAIQRQLADDLDHGLVTGVEVLRLLNRGHGDRASLMPVVFASTINLRARDRQDVAFGLTSHLFQLGEGGREVGSSIRTPQVWLDHQVLEEAGGLVFNWDVVEDLFPAGMIDAMFARYQLLLERLSGDASAWAEVINRIALAPDQLAARDAVNATATPIAPRLLHAAFCDQAARQPERPAVITTARALSYRELDLASEHLAHQLVGCELGAHRLVGVVLPKGWQQLVAVLAIHKAGAAYLPMDPALPDARIAHLVAHAGVTTAITLPGLASRLAAVPGLAHLTIDDAPAPSELPAAGRLTSRATPDSLAYVIYTSGSTGMPKGVAVSHAAAWNTIADLNQRFAIGPEDRTFAISSLSFDLSVYDVFGLLAAGGAVVVPDQVEAREPGRWLEMVRDHRVTLWNSVPALITMLAEHAASASASLAAVRIALLSGDWIAVSLPGALHQVQPDLEVISLGGATEAAIWSIYFPIDEVPPHWSSIPYGRPLANQRFAVLDCDLNPRPVHVPGELYIAGDGLALGYWNDPERTAASFVCHPRNGERLYRTGDLGRYLPDGVIEFLGRDDGQVKVQGYRIELGEIDASLDRLPELAAATTIAVGERAGNKTLVSYVVPRGAVPLDLEAIRRRLETMLPIYMVPTTYVVLDALPLTSNGKVDRKALPAPGAQLTAGPARVAPRDELEAQLAALWRELLDVDDVGVLDNFFAIGGQSFLAMRLMARIRKERGVSLPLGALMNGGTIAALADQLRAAGVQRPWTPLVEIQPGAGAPLVLIHPVGGNILCYLDLARGLAPHPLWGLTAAGLQAGQAPLPTIEAMAGSYLGALRGAGLTRQPLRLAGWSLGGVVALEMAHQAEAAGLAVELVMMIDSRLEATPAQPGETLGLINGFLADLGRAAGRAVAPVPDSVIVGGELDVATVLGHARGHGMVPDDFDRDTFERLWQVYRAGILALAAHRPRPVRAPVIDLWARDQPQPATRVDWATTCPALERRPIGGDHYTLLQPPHRETLTALVAGYLDDSSRTLCGQSS